MLARHLAPFVFFLVSNLVSAQVNPDSIYLNVDRFPYAEECAGEEDLAAVKNCTNKILLRNVQMRLKYPHAARVANAQGKVLVSFVINQQGRITQPKIIKEPGFGIGASCVQTINEVSEVVQLVPAEVDGQAVNYKMILPVTYRYAGNVQRIENINIPQDTYLVFLDSKGGISFKGMVSKEVQDAIPGKFIAHIKTIDFVKSRKLYNVIGAVNEVKFKRHKLVLPDEIKKLKVDDIQNISDIDLSIQRLTNLPQVNISVLSSDIDIQYYVHNLPGDVFASGAIPATNGHLEKIDITKAPKGVLCVSIVKGNSLYSHLLVND